jgi:hypothetical protein
MQKVATVKGAALAGAVFAVGLVLGWFGGGGAPVANGQQRAASAGLNVLPPPAGVSTSCVDSPGAVLAYVAELAPGRSSSDLTSRGYSVRPAFTNAASSMIVVGDGTIAPSNDLITNGTVASMGAVRTHSKSPSLAGCDYHLIEAPGAKPFVNAAATYFENAGTLSASQIASNGTIYYLSDNPLDSKSVIVTFVIEDAVDPSKLDPAQLKNGSQYIHPFSAILDQSSLRVEAAGPASWYQ